ncbi:sensor histidine kinase [Nakamurella aerolata]|uniref:histidine kinase n=1 Tax=Nakamurella aerolata TaxID=1656892 RepID=A0A849A7U9_9ACTN|nr:histidine kinase [Nakamurella aerolata]NNG36575.1 hypothetical protein [Nakamurella aerolata]
MWLLDRWHALSTGTQDLIIALTCGATGTLLLALDIVGNHNLPFWVRLLLLLLACAAQTQRRRFPMVALALGAVPIVIDAAFGFTIGPLIVLTDLVYAAVLYGGRGSQLLARWLIGATLVAAVLLALQADDLRVGVLIALTLIVVIVTPVQWALTLGAHRDRADLERRRADDLHRMAELDRAAAVAAQRNEVARELHDVISGHLSAIALRSSAALELSRPGSGGEPPTAPALEVVRTQSLQALTAMRSMIDMLQQPQHDSDTQRWESAPGWPQVLDRLPDRAVVHRHPDPLPQLGAELGRQLVRIVLPAVGNAAEHAPGQPIRVDVTHAGGTLQLSVQNPIGDNAPKPAGDRHRWGVANIAARVAALGGTVSIGPAGDGGKRGDSGARVWRVAVAVPVPAAESVGGQGFATDAADGTDGTDGAEPAAPGGETVPTLSPLR